MDPVTVILAAILAATASDRSTEKERRRGAKTKSQVDAADAAELLTEAWPPHLREIDFAWADLMDAARGTTVVPWTAEQLESFRRGVLMCPKGHAPDHCETLELEVRGMPLTKVCPGAYKRHPAGTTVEHSCRGLVVCTHPDHSDADRMFWFPYHLLGMR